MVMHIYEYINNVYSNIANKVSEPASQIANLDRSNRGQISKENIRKNKNQNQAQIAQLKLQQYVSRM